MCKNNCNPKNISMEMQYNHSKISSIDVGKENNL